jgi:hypothetical protein
LVSLTGTLTLEGLLGAVISATRRGLHLLRVVTPALVRLWSLAMQRRPAPLGCLQLGIVALAPAGTVRCPVMPP